MNIYFLLIKNNGVSLLFQSLNKFLKLKLANFLNHINQTIGIFKKIKLFRKSDYSINKLIKILK